MADLKTELITQPESVNDLLQSNMVLRVEDIVAVAMDATQQQADANMADLKRQQSENGRLRNETVQRIARAKEAALESSSQPARAKINEFVKLLAIKARFGLLLSLVWFDDKKNRGVGALHYKVKGGADHEATGMDLTVRFEVLGTEQMLADQKALQVCSETDKDLSDALLNWKKFEADAPRRELAFRSTLAQKRLEKSVAGQDILASLLDRGRSDADKVAGRTKFKALPAPK